jgi:hypothetical protein
LTTTNKHRSSWFLKRKSQFVLEASFYANSRTVLTILAVKHVADGAATRGVGFHFYSSFHGVHWNVGFRFGGIGFGFAATWAAIREARFIWAKFKFLGANDTGSDWKSHSGFYVSEIDWVRRPRDVRA